MRYALRRILWIVPTLGAISIVAFWLLTLGDGGNLLVTGVGAPETRQRLSALPRFFNSNPRSVRDLALDATRSVAEAAPDAKAAELELVRLGGAALPHILPRFDALEPAGRARVALSLSPLARRMGLAAGRELDAPDTAVLFWTRYWQDRAIDFRPAVVRRLVRRVAQRPSLRDDDVLQLDTYALQEIMDAFGTLRGPEDIARVRRLVELSARATGIDWRIGPSASLDDARTVVRRWRSWWALSRADYVTFDGPGRALASLTETQYGKWASEAARNRLGVGSDGRPVLDTLLERAPVTLWLVASSVLGGYSAGVALGLVAAGSARNPWRPTRRRRRARLFDWALSATALVLCGVPVAGLATALAPAAAGGFTRFWGALLAVAVAAALVSRHQRQATTSVLEQEAVRTELALGASPLRAARRCFRAASSATVSLLGVDLPALFTVAFLIEGVLGIRGLGPVTLEAVQRRDLSWLMAIAVLSALSVALVQIASDLMLAALDPRVRIALERRRGAPE